MYKQLLAHMSVINSLPVGGSKVASLFWPNLSAAQKTGHENGSLQVWDLDAAFHDSK